MRKFYFLLLSLLFGMTATINAQDANESITTWDGTDLSVTLNAGESKTFSYTATEQGKLYIMATTASTNLGISISGGWYHDGAYDADAPFDTAEPYDNGAGIFATIAVFSGDEIRFTLTADEVFEGEDAVTSTSFIMKSSVYASNYGGDTWENPINMNISKTVSFPVYANHDVDYLADFSHATFARFEAPTDGVVSVMTSEYLVYYIEEELYGSQEMKYAVQASMTDDHEFAIENGKAYILMIPVTRPTNVSLRITSDRLGENCAFPVEITEFPANLSLVKGNNWFKMNVSELGTTNFMEIVSTAGWEGNIEYWNNCNVTNEWLTSDVIIGTSETFYKDINPVRLETAEYLYFNVQVTNGTPDNGLTLSLREPKEGESCNMATPIQLGENQFKGLARDQWFSYTATKDAEMTITSTGTLKYISFNCDDTNNYNGTDTYRVNEGQTFFFCITTNNTETNTITISEKELVDGDYCDRPIDFVLGENVVIADRGDDVINYRRFVAEESGTAIFETTCANWVEYFWSVVFRNDCEGRAIDYVRNEYEDENNGDLGLSYRIPVTKGETYIIEISSFANDGADAIVTSRFEAATTGSNCETAIAIENLGEEIEIPNTPDLTVWYTYTADKSGFYTIKSKIGRGSTMKTMTAECTADLVNSATDNSYSDAYMAGYKVSKIYVEQGTPFFVCVTISSDPGETAGTNRYIIASFAEARPGEYFGSPIQAVAGTTYYLPNTDDAYDTWYAYTIPAGTECIFNIGSDITPSYGSLAFYSDETTTMSAYKGDFTQTNNKNANNQMCGKTYTFAAGETDRIVYIKTSYQKNLHWWDITLDGGESINDINAENSMIVYPNPTDGTFYVNVPTVENGAKITVTTLTGKVVYNASISSNVTNVTLNTTGGIYLVTVSNGNSVETAKLIVK
ncbi:MAG: T9SS type A sorting domain-containing protein [Paraprevotella sp.]|nr:T9SS type A sorting domain-containing protein [Paraprevotella sp.]